MPDILETGLKRLADIQMKHAKLLAVFGIIITVVLGIGLKDLYINSDIRKELPQDIPIFKLNDRVSDKFGGKDMAIIVAQIDNSIDMDSAVRDIRDPRVIQSFIFLDNELRDKESVTSIGSPASFFRGKDSISSELIEKTMRMPGASAFFSRDYTTSVMYISADIGGGEEHILSFNRLVQEYVDQTPKPPGVKFTVTGAPVLRVAIFDLLKRDAVVTLTVAAIIILILLFVMQRSFAHGLLIFIPLSLGLIWTMGTLGWFGIPLAVSTVGLSSMILGLGVEYGVFVVSRYKEERDKKFSQLDSLKTTVHGIGIAIIGSGLTTIVGFGVLSFATVPMIQHLGQTLALGIAFCLLAALFVNPVFILLEEEYEIRSTRRNFEKLAARKEEYALGEGFYDQ